MNFLVIFGLILKLTNAEDYFQIEDIPIESFEIKNADVRNDDMDVELIRRFQRSFPIHDEDPKEYFFRNARSNNDEKRYEEQGDIDLPRPGGFYFNDDQKLGKNTRHKREALSPDSLKQNIRVTKSLVRGLGKPLELSVIDPESLTGTIDGSQSITNNDAREQNLLINDFIRFKRSTIAENVADDVTKVKEIMKNIEKDNKSKMTDTNLNSKSGSESKEDISEPYAHTEKLIMDRNMDEQEGMREARGATKQQWVKQVYPVRRNDDLDNSPSSESARAPRVHFVTQRMEESSFRPEYSYDRQARIRGLQGDLARNLSPYDSREMDYYQPRFTRNYSPPPSYERYRNDRYFDYDMRDPYDAYRPRSRYYEYPDRARDNYIGSNNSNNNKQRRIIYYATLPDISRSPSNSDFRDGYDYRDRYQDRYFTPDPSYGLRKPYTKSRYEEKDGGKDYSHKVSTDVNVRDVKKNPERRIYSEVDRNRYTPNQSYQNDRI